MSLSSKPDQPQVPADEPPLGGRTPSGGSAPRVAGERGGNDLPADEPPLGGRTPSGGSAPRVAGERGGNVLRETDDAARAQSLAFIRESFHGALATLEPETLWPLASRVSIAVDADGVPLILISRLSAHYGALEADARCSLLLGEAGEGDPLRHPRITLVCIAQKIPPQLRAAAKAQFLQRHPGAEMYADFTDFDFWRLVTQRASLNAGFGKAYALSASDLL